VVFKITVSPSLFIELINLSAGIHHFTEYTTPSTDSCINTANNCSAHPPLIYQFLYENDNIAFTFRIKWNPDSRVECTPNVYHVLIKQERDNSLNLSTCNDFVSTSKLFLVNTSYNDFYYQKPFTGGRPRNIYYIKVVAHPLYEYPTLKFSAPTGCTNQFDGCQVCDTSCSDDVEMPIPKITVNTFLSVSNELMMSANVSWFQPAGVNIREYFMHVYTSLLGKRLYKINGDTLSVQVDDIPSNDNESFVYLEQFSCSCSEKSDIHYFNQNYSIIDNDDLTTKSPEPTQLHLLSSIESSLASTTLYSIFNTYNTPEMTQLYLLSSSLASTTLYSIFNTYNTPEMTPELTTSSTPSSIGTSPPLSMPSILSYLIPLIACLLVAIIIFVTIAITVLLVKRRNIKRRKKIDPNESSLPIPIALQPLQQELSVITIIPHNSKDKEEYLRHLYNLVDYGINLLTYDRANRETPAEWLDTVFKPHMIVLVVINKHFHRQWNGEHQADIPIVFALKQLVCCLYQQSKELKNFALILPHPSDKQYIPNMLHSLRCFKLQEIEDVSRFIFEVPEYTFT
jgi:hypothetical protein